MRFTIVSYSFIGRTTGYYRFPKETLIGGGEVYLYDFAKFLVKEGHDVTILQAGEKNETITFDDIRVKKIRLPLSLPGELGILERYWLFNRVWPRHVPRGTERVHLHDYMHGAPHARKTMSGTSHGITWDNPEYRRWSRLGMKLRAYRSFIRPIARKSIRRLGRIIANDTFLLRYVQSEMPEKREKIRVIFNYVRTDIFNPTVKPHPIREEYKDRRIILFPRNFGYARGGLNTVKAARILSKKYPDILFVMTGEGPEKPLAQAYVKKHRLSNHVLFIGHQHHFKSMPSLFKAADIVIIPSTSTEGTSLSGLEAMATEKPVVATNIGGLPDIIHHDYTGILVQPNAQSLAEGIERYLKDPSFAKRMARNARRWVEMRHTYEYWCKQYKEALDI